MAMDSERNARRSLEQYRLFNACETGLEFGRGSYAAVVQVDFKGLRCAGKKIHRIFFEGQVENYVRRFEEECRLLSQLRHPHVVQFLGIYFEVDTNAPVLVMEFLPTTLTQCLDRYGVMPEEINYSILQDVAVGLRYLHDREDPIVHRDLSANNVLLTKDMKAKISDLGVAKILEANPKMMFTMTKTPGTQCYMPPETLAPRPCYDVKVDIFSYGVMIMHVLSGEWPFPKAAVEVGPQNELIPLSEFDRRKDYIKDVTVAECPLIDLLKSCMSNSPSHRPASSEVHQQVSAVAADHPPSFANRVEMLERIKALEQAKDEREAEAENAKQDTSNLKDINHELGSHSSQPLSDRHLDRQIKEMESINKELVASCELASQQLSARREEMKRQQTRIEELEKELDEALQENAELKNVHDNMLHSNTEALDKLHTLLDEKLKTIVELQDLVQCLEKEKAELKDTVHQLSDQLASLKEVKMTGRTCAICQTNFHERINEIEFQSHIISHYQDLGRQNEDMKSINKELVASCEVATQQLSARKKEMKKQQTRIKELEKELDQAIQEIAAAYRTCPVCQTKFPLRISKYDFDNHVRCHFENDGQSAQMKSKELVASCEVASRQSSARKTRIEELEKELDQAKHKIGVANRTCPICETLFPGRVPQGDFERHVQGHFDTV